MNRERPETARELPLRPGVLACERSVLALTSRRRRLLVVLLLVLLLVVLLRLVALVGLVGRLVVGREARGWRRGKQPRGSMPGWSSWNSSLVRWGYVVVTRFDWTTRARSVRVGNRRRGQRGLQRGRRRRRARPERHGHGLARQHVEVVVVEEAVDGAAGEEDVARQLLRADADRERAVRAGRDRELDLRLRQLRGPSSS